MVILSQHVFFLLFGGGGGGGSCVNMIEESDWLWRFCLSMFFYFLGGWGSYVIFL